MESDNERSQITHLIDDMIIFLHQLYCTAEIVQSAGLHRTESRICGCFCIDRREEIHIKVGRNAAGQIFHDTKNIQPVHIILRKLSLAREHLLVQPVLQRQIIRVGT